MHFYILTLFPEFFDSPLSATMLQRGQERGTVQFSLTNIRDFASDKHRTTDDAPYGGGYGMVMKPEPVVAAVESIRREDPSVHTILLSPRGQRFEQKVAEDLAERDSVSLLCGRYEGVDERVRDYVDDEISLGDFVLSGGEAAALAIIDAVSRLIPGSLGSAGSLDSESFKDSLLEYPQYTRPPDFRGQKVPEVLLSGNHASIAKWRRRQSLERTLRQRPDLIREEELDDDDRRYLNALRAKS